MKLELELKVVAALLSIGRPAELSELRAAIIRLGVPDQEAEAPFELPASLRLSDGRVTFSDQASSFFQHVVLRFSCGADRAAKTSVKDCEEAAEAVFVVATETEHGVFSGNEEMQADHEMTFAEEAQDNSLLCGKTPHTLQLTYLGNEGMQTGHEMAFVGETGKAAQNNSVGPQLCGKMPDNLQLTYPANEGMQAEKAGKQAHDSPLSPQLCGKTPDSLQLAYFADQGVAFAEQTGSGAQGNCLNFQFCGKTPDCLQLTYPENEGRQADQEVAFAEETRDTFQLCGKSPDALQLTYPGNEETQAYHEAAFALEAGEKIRDDVSNSRRCGKTPDVLQLCYKDPQAQDEAVTRAMVAVTSSFFSSKRLRPTPDEVPPSFDGYKVESLEGSGGYSVVYKALRLRDDKVFAIKRPITGHQRGHVENEIRMLNLLGGKHGIVALEDIIRCSDDTCLVLEYIKHDTTEILKEEMTVDEIRSYGFSLFKALSYMHQKNVMHRDVKPANFLFDRKERVGRLIDFNLAAVASVPEPVNAQSALIQYPHTVKRSFPGEAAFPNKTAKLVHKTAKLAREPVPTLGRRKLLDHLDKTVANSEEWCSVVAKKRVTSREVISAKKGVRKATAVGTRGYNAPEVLLKSARQTVQVDVWSAGVTLWQLAMEKLPFSSAGKDQILREVARMRGIEPLRELAKKHSCVLNLSEEFQGKPMEKWAANCPTRKDGLTASFFDLVERCLQVDPERRITARDAMRHKFFSPCLKARKRNS